MVHVGGNKLRTVGRRALEWLWELSSEATLDERELPTKLI